MHPRPLALLSLLTIASLSLSPIKADSATVGMTARDQVMADVAAFLSEPPAVEIVATLEPPETTYTVEIPKEFSAQYNELARRLDEVGVKIGENGPKYGEFLWAGEVSCGYLGNAKTWEFTWSHPDGPPPECPHEQGTDHPGTITVSNLLFRFALREASAVDEEHVTNESLAKLNAEPRLAEYLWTMECRYTDGSKPGRARCTGTLRTGQDAAAGGTTTTNTNAAVNASTNTNAAGQIQGSGAGAAGAAAAGGAVAVGAAAYWWWRRPFNWEDIQRRWKIK